MFVWTSSGSSMTCPLLAGSNWTYQNVTQDDERNIAPRTVPQAHQLNHPPAPACPYDRFPAGPLIIPREP
ncbi:hypothetical protein BV22DRAFT_1039469 [Leucogyrophana mollusca]|uniref:Uncharacterized protein n=1 Tax=Leucogyrophana mollusca TaxID=85980 RepID=A0ACB8B4T8_9AGAM|nr:hypothetical protein BV22DRAFT_1039469 [Leucogyrophana mollusca]